MDKQKRKAIEHHNADLMESMDPHAVLDNLRARFLSPSEKESILEPYTRRRDKNRELISILFRKREELKPFEGFVEALKQTDASHAIMADAILKTHKYDNDAALAKVPRTSPLAAGENEYGLQIAQQSLKYMYLTRFQKVYPFSLPFLFDIENTWVSLALKEEEKDSQATEDHTKLLKRAFDKVKMLIIEGNPATGKTSLMRRLAYEWAKEKEKLLHYDLVLYAEFREKFLDLQLKNKKKNILTIIFSHQSLTINTTLQQFTIYWQIMRI
uniref:CARD domain-containing protein n=1 Tax=Plectus sambesii TaxID=2011161 RepID=A0A914VU09_9BILA